MVLASIAKNDNQIPNTMDQMDLIMKNFMHERGYEVEADELSLHQGELALRRQPSIPKKNYAQLEIGVIKNMLKYLLKKNEAIEDAQFFIANPDYQIIAGFTNLTDTTLVRKMRKFVLLDKIAINSKFYFTPSFMQRILKAKRKNRPVFLTEKKVKFTKGELLPEDLITSNPKYLRVRMIFSKDLPTFRKNIKVYNKPSKNLDLEFGLSDSFSSKGEDVKETLDPERAPKGEEEVEKIIKTKIENEKEEKSLENFFLKEKKTVEEKIDRNTVQTDKNTDKKKSKELEREKELDNFFAGAR